MPDISMCAATGCPKSRQCYRHEDSGTVPNEWRQSYIMGEPNGDCRNFWQVSALVKSAHDGTMS